MRSRTYAESGEPVKKRMSINCLQGKELSLEQNCKHLCEVSGFLSGN